MLTAFHKYLCVLGAGYPSSYYPYIIATLVDTVPQECGGTGGQVILVEPYVEELPMAEDEEVKRGSLSWSRRSRKKVLSVT